jgi:hypothetical protein
MFNTTRLRHPGGVLLTTALAVLPAHLGGLGPRVSARAAMIQEPAEQEPAETDQAAPTGEDEPQAERPSSSPSRARGRRARSTTPRKAVAGAGKAVAGTSKQADGTAKAPAASAPGDTSFKIDVAPILVANCVNCHRQKGRGLTRGKLDLTSFESLMKGTPKEKVVVPGKPEESHLVLRIKGDETPQMPLSDEGSTLSDGAIGIIEKWVREGARLDPGVDPGAPLESYAASPEAVRRNKLARMSAKERDQQVEAAGRERWKKANPRLKPEITSREHFLLFSNLPRDRAENAAKLMEADYSQMKRLLGEAATSWGEKVGLYIFNDRKDFIEFVRTVEGREVEEDVGFTGNMKEAEPYVAVVDPLGGRKDEPAPRRRVRVRRGADREAPTGPDRTLGGLLTEALGTCTLAAQGQTPRWLSAGFGAVLASQVEPRSRYYDRLRGTAWDKHRQGWDHKATEALGEGEQASIEEIRAVGFAVVDLLLSPPFREAFPGFARSMSEGREKLDEAIQKAYDANREQFLSQTGEWVAERYGNSQ